MDDKSGCSCSSHGKDSEKRDGSGSRHGSPSRDVRSAHDEQSARDERSSCNEQSAREGPHPRDEPESLADREPRRRVQAAAIEHAFTVGPPARGLRLAGALEAADGVSSHDAGATRTAGALLPLVTALVWADDTRASAAGPDHSRSAAEQTIRGAAIAVARHGVSVPRAAEAADAPAAAVADARERLDVTESPDVIDD